MGLFLSNEVRLRELEEKEAAREQQANDLFQQKATVSTAVDRLSRIKQQQYHRKRCQIIVRRDYSITHGKKEMAGSLLNIIEDTLSIDSAHNVRWIIQQIIHGVTGTYVGLQTKQYQRVSEYEQTISEFPGDHLKMDCHIQTYVYASNGGFLKTRNLDKFVVRIVMGIKY
eukprot:268059_1